jgi:hypothetical protein
MWIVLLKHGCKICQLVDGDTARLAIRRARSRVFLTREPCGALMPRPMSFRQQCPGNCLKVGHTSSSGSSGSTGASIGQLG